jgi:hypothetical protein
MSAGSGPTTRRTGRRPNASPSERWRPTAKYGFTHKYGSTTLAHGYEKLIPCFQEDEISAKNIKGTEKICPSGKICARTVANFMKKVYLIVIFFTYRVINSLDSYKNYDYALISLLPVFLTILKPESSENAIISELLSK